MKCFEDDRLDYDPETGVFTWRISPTNRVKAGSVAGSNDRKGYSRIMVGGKKLAASHLAWNTLHPDDPVMPGEEIDHINHVRDDNRALNIRKTNARGNSRNRSLRTDSKYGLSGLGWRKKEGMWIVQVGPKGEAYRGLFSDLLSAAAEVFRGRRELAFHENHGAKKNG